MSKNNLPYNDNEEQEPVLEFIDENGNIERFILLDFVSLEDSDYAVLLPESEDDELPENVYVFEVIEELDSETDTYIGIDDQELVDKVYALFMENHKDDYNFI